MQRFELGKKFWEVDLVGPKVVARWGEVGDVKSKTTTFPTVQVAASEAAKLIAKVTTLGYRLAEGEGEAAQLEKAILRNVHDPKPWQVYGDFLAERGDVRGELAGLVVGKPGRVNGFVRAKAAQLFGPLATLYASGAFEAKAWSPGFIGHLHVDIDGLALGGKDLKAILALPVCALIHSFSSTSSRADNWQHSLAQLAASPQAAWLESLELDGLGEHTLGDVSASLPKFRALKTLIVDARANDFGALDLPELVELTRTGGDWRQEEAKPLMKGKFPKLERLELGFDAYEEDIDVPLLVERQFRRKSLRELYLTGVGFAGDLAEQLFDSALFPGLRVLDLEGCWCDEDAHEQFIENRDILAKVKTVRLPDVGDSEHATPMDLGIEREDEEEEDEDEEPDED